MGQLSQYSHVTRDTRLSPAAYITNRFSQSLENKQTKESNTNPNIKTN